MLRDVNIYFCVFTPSAPLDVIGDGFGQKEKTISQSATAASTILLYVSCAANQNHIEVPGLHVSCSPVARKGSVYSSCELNHLGQKVNISGCYGNICIITLYRNALWETSKFHRAAIFYPSLINIS